ncbi:MAG: cytochrome c, partial [Elusimicrobia bacterium]|nr:cytochrome c [Elusimicrobiota bacterium]
AAAAGAALSSVELDARFYYDLGPDTVDVAGYPESAKKGYAVFRAACSRCHSPARALNTPLTRREDFERFLKRMHVKTASRKGSEFSKQDAAAILEFLTHDAKVRKVDGKEAFQRQAADLQSRFKALEVERAERLRKEGKQRVKTPAPYTGAKP